MCCLKQATEQLRGRQLRSGGEGRECALFDVVDWTAVLALLLLGTHSTGRDTSCWCHAVTAASREMEEMEEKEQRTHSAKVEARV